MLRTASGCLLVLALFASVCDARSTVLVDEAHGQRFLVEREEQLDLSKLAAIFRAQGLELTIGRSQVADETLANVDALVISGAFAPFTEGETAATLRFLERGGRLCVMLHIAPPVSTLLTALNVSFSNGVIREASDLLDTDPLNFRVKHLSSHDVVRGLEAFNVYGAWALLSRGANVEVIAQTGPEAWVDLNGNRTLDPRDAVQSFAVAVGGDVGKGSFVVFGDDAIFQNRFLEHGNDALAKNLARWLAGGIAGGSATERENGAR